MERERKRERERAVENTLVTNSPRTDTNLSFDAGTSNIKYSQRSPWSTSRRAVGGGGDDEGGCGGEGGGCNA